MKKILALLLVLLFAVPAFGNPLSTGGGTPSVATPTNVLGNKAVWWKKDLTFWAPLNDPAAPLNIEKGTGTFTFTRAHDATHTATYVHPGTGLVTAASADQLRIEANGALIEGARTNIALQSEVFKTTWSATTVTIVDDNTVAPDGTSTADQLQATNTNGTVLQTVTGTAVPYTFTVYLKRKDGTGNVDVTANGTNYTTCTINTSTWTRCGDTRTLTVAAYTPGIRIATNLDNVYAWGAQMEIGSFASSYIPTVAGAMIRNADVLTFPTTSNVSGTVGTAYAEYKTMVNNGATSQYILDLGASRPALFINGADEKVSINDGANTLSFGTADTHGTSYRAASRWSSGDSVMRVVRGGGTVATAAFDGNMNLGANATVGDTGAGGSQLWGNIRNIRIWSRVFTDAELIALTSP